MNIPDTHQSSFGIAHGGIVDQEQRGEPRSGLATSVAVCPSTERLCLAAVPRCDGCKHQSKEVSPPGMK